ALRCLQKQPSRRYATAGALAEDLERFLRQEPIQARPAGRIERAWRKVRRRPALAGGLLLAVFSLLALGAGSWLWLDARRSTASAGSLSPDEARTEYHAWVLHPESDPLPGSPLAREQAERTGGWRVLWRGKQVVRIDAVGRQGRLLRHNPYHRLA